MNKMNEMDKINTMQGHVHGYGYGGRSPPDHANEWGSGLLYTLQFGVTPPPSRPESGNIKGFFTPES